MNFSIRFDIPFYLIAIFAAMSVGVSYLMYHNVAGISKSNRTFLGLLRALSVFLLLLAMANLVTDIVRITTKKRDVYVLVDDSKSMALNDGTVSRAQLTKDVLRSIKGISPHLNIVPIIFGGHAVEAAGPSAFDSLKFDKPATDIEAAFVEAAKHSQQSPGEAAFGILLSDGDYNAGGNPVNVAQGFSIPVYSIGIGDSTRPKDIAVRQLIPSPSIYAGKKSVVKSIISSFGFGGTTVNVHLVDDEKDVESKDVKLPGDGDVEVAFDYTASAVGTHILKVYVAPQNGEVNLRNNSATATVDVMKGKYSVLLVAGEPAVDVAFLRRNIESSDDFELTTLVQKDANDFYVPTGENGREVNASTTDPSEILSKKYDAVLLYDFPNAHFSVATNHDSPMQKVLDVLNSSDAPFAKGLPYAYFAGRDFSAQQVVQLPRLPFTTGNSGSEISPGDADLSSRPDVFQTARNSDNSEFQIGISTMGFSQGISPEENIPASLQPIYSLLSSNSNLIPPLYYRRIDCKSANGATALAVPVLNGVRLDVPIFFMSQFRKERRVPRLRVVAHPAYEFT